MIKDNATTSRNIEKAYQDNKYIVTSRVIYQPFYSVNAGYYAQPVYRLPRGEMQFIGSGRFIHASGEHVNRLIGFEHLNNL